MRSIEEVNAEYSRLCALIGEQTYRIKQLEQERNNNIRRIEVLEDEARAVKAAEGEATHGE